MRKSVNYINNKDLYDEMVKFIDARKAALAAGEPIPRMSNYIGKSIAMIATRLATKPNFSGYSFKEEMIGDGIENCVMYLHNFNPAKSKNPFAYITFIIWRAFLRRIEKEGKHSYIRHKLMFSQSAIEGMEGLDKADEMAIASMMESSQNEKSADIIAKFETKLSDKKKKSKAKKEEADAE